jgi:hypothetical protein
VVYSGTQAGNNLQGTLCAAYAEDVEGHFREAAAEADSLQSCLSQASIKTDEPAKSELSDASKSESSEELVFDFF